MDDFLLQAQELFEYTRAIRRDLHRHPEMGFKETRTAGIVARSLSELGMEVQTGIAETGVVGLLEGGQPGPVALLRFDMDALPVQEETGADYSSSVPGVMHACGHDGHVAVGLTVARLLAAHREELTGSVKLVFQPAEEGLGGAQKMIEQGVLEGPRVDYTLALHLWNDRPAGWLGISPGPLMAGGEIFHARIIGRGGHGALPQHTVDPIVAAAHVITGLQTVVSRNLSPLESAVVSVCQIHAGEAFNVIPQSVELVGTIRTFEPEVRQKVVERFEALFTGLAESFGCAAEVNLQRLTPAVINDPKWAALVEQAARRVLPDDQIEPNCRTMVSEDMAYFMEQSPGCYFLVGCGFSEAEKRYPHHHPRFDIDENALPRAAALMAAATLETLRHAQ
jgi:amidohydrolase